MKKKAVPKAVREVVKEMKENTGQQRVLAKLRQLHKTHARWFWAIAAVVLGAGAVYTSSRLSTQNAHAVAMYSNNHPQIVAKVKAMGSGFGNRPKNQNKRAIGNAKKNEFASVLLPTEFLQESVNRVHRDLEEPIPPAMRSYKPSGSNAARSTRLSRTWADIFKEIKMEVNKKKSGK